MRKKIRSSLVITTVLCLCFPNFIVQAQEISQDSITAQYTFGSLTAETESIIADVEEQYDIPKSYFYNIVEMYFDNGHTDLAELNSAIQDAANQVSYICEKTDVEYEQIFSEYQANVTSNAEEKANILYGPAIAAYNVGISIVRGRNCPQTAKSMEHAIVPEASVGTGWKPGRLFYNNDEWSRFLITTQALFQKIDGQLQHELESGKDVITVNGSHEFTRENSSLDAFAQLHNVNYSITFVKRPDGVGYVGNYLISDIYDFAWGNYDNFEVGFANNYCKAVQDAGFIAPYPISIAGEL